jgi:hypothetical protein
LRSWFGVINGWSILLLFGMMVVITGIKIIKSHSIKNKSSIQEFV